MTFGCLWFTDEFLFITQVRKRGRRAQPPSDTDMEEGGEGPAPTSRSPSTSRRSRTRASSSGQGTPPDFSVAPPGVLPGTVGLWPDLSYMVQGGFQFLSLDGMPVLPVTPSDATHVSFIIILTFNPLTYFGM